MGQTNINVRIDSKLKADFDKLCEELGLTMSTAINMFAKAMVRFQGIPFEVSMNKLNEDTLQAIEDIENGKNLIGPFNDMEELIKSLNEEDS